MQSSFRFLALGRWREQQVSARFVPSSRRVVPAVEAAIEATWARITANPAVKLFDGPVCRLESFKASERSLSLDLSATTYRINVGTNFFHPGFAEEYGVDVMANPLGVSAGLISSDGFLLMGRRNGSVAYYPHQLHPFAGSAEVRESINLFDDVRRELNEELGFTAREIESIECVGIGEDAQLRHPEMLFIVHTNRSRSQVEASVHPEEHGSSEAVLCERSALQAFAERHDVTPIGRAVAERIAQLIA